MTDKEIKLVSGALLHDIGKVIFRSGVIKQHSLSGYEYLKDEAGIQDRELLDCVRYHHWNLLSSAKLNQDALAYIVYLADNIAAAVDRRKNDGTEKGYDPKVPLQSIFNILNGNQQNYHYRAHALTDDGNINMPTDKPLSFDQSFYQNIKIQMTDTLKGIENWKPEYLNSLLSTMEAYLTYIPSSTALHELADISLYDHVKMTAAISSCIYQYLQAEDIQDYHTVLFKKSEEFYQTEAFRLFSMDISGIQKFIYTIHSEGALAMLRARSFYLEILMESMIDEILDACKLSRANLIYSGGGHCYILLPNTKEVCEIIEEKKQSFNDFFLRWFDIGLFVAMDSVSCSAYQLQNKPEGSYAEIFRRLSESLSTQKSMRFSPAKIRYLNKKGHKDNTRECKVCKNSGFLNEKDLCLFCEKLSRFSSDILYKDFFTTFLTEKENAIPLPDGRYLLAQTESEVKESMENDNDFVRTYGKNRFYTGKSVTTKLWVGDYTQKGKNTEEYAKEATGIDRIAVLRADVDNLGQAFVAGFPSQYTTLSRTATFSRQLSLFFKHHLNAILGHGMYKMNGENGEAGERKVTIVYSGGDDLFLVGSWDDVLEAAVDVKKQLEIYTQNTLTLSAGIGLFHAKYPMSVCAQEVAVLEDRSKEYTAMDGSQKNAVTVFEETYGWDVFSGKVIEEKYALLEKFLTTSQDRGKAFLYRLLELIREMKDDRLNLARFAYVLTRLAPENSQDEIQKTAYQEFSRTLYTWVQDAEEKRQLVTAIYIYVYLHREVEE